MKQSTPSSGPLPSRRKRSVLTSETYQEMADGAPLEMVNVWHWIKMQKSRTS